MSDTAQRAKSRIFGRADREAFESFVVMVRHAKPLLPVGGQIADGLFDLSLRSIRTYLRLSFTSRNRDGALFRIYPGYTDERGANAFAWHSGPVYVCGVGTGLVTALFELSMFCFQQRKFFPQIGMSGRETSPCSVDGCRPSSWLSQPSAYPDRHALLRETWPFTPQDPSRKAAALYLFHLALRFVWFHEYYHCINGHVSYVAVEKLSLCLNESAVPQDGARSSRRLRCLEFDADQAALWAIMQIQANGTENLLGIQALPGKLRIRLQLAAIYLTVWLLEETARLSGQRRVSTHPKPYSRLLNLLGCLAWHVSPAVPDLEAVHADVLIEIGSLCTVLPGMPTPEQVAADGVSETQYRHIHYYLNDLRLLHRKLLQHAFYTDRPVPALAKLYASAGVPMPY